MCFHSKQSQDAQTLEHRFNAKFIDAIDYVPSEDYNAFAYPKTPIITNQKPDEIQLYNWGLIPKWAKDTEGRPYTLNARIETIAEKPSFKYSLQNRCLILVNGFYEWHWLDPKGSKKQKYLLTEGHNESFAIAGLWNIWTHPVTAEVFQTYTLLTTEANKQMSYIHNSKKRMPMILEKNEEAPWLDEEEISPNREHIKLIETLL